MWRRMHRFQVLARPSSCPVQTMTCARCFSFSKTRHTDWSVNLDTGVVSCKRQPLFQTVIGLEIHAQLDIPTKLFSSAPSASKDAGALPNTHVWPLDGAVPGVLPRLSQEAVHAAVLTAAACQCIIPWSSRFERKHYAYADLPLGYQVTQQRWPLAREGVLTCRRKVDPKDRKKQSGGEDSFFTVAIDRIQLEQDTGKTTTVVKQESGHLVTESLVDFNRAGCALVEIVFGPNLRSAHDAAAAVATLRDMMRMIGTCDGKMEEGSLRCDLNISIAPLNEKSGGKEIDVDNPFRDMLPPGTGHRVEVKNLNSMRQVVAAAEYEAKRQAQAYENGTPTAQETRTFDVQRGHTVSTRTKGGAVDYRFMPEPDLPPIVLDTEAFDGLTLHEFVDTNLPELPEQATKRLMKQYELTEDVALVITGDPPAITFYEETVQAARNALERTKAPIKPKQLYTTVANWLCNDLFALVKEGVPGDSGGGGLVDSEESALSYPISVQYSRVSASQLGELVALMVEEFISTTMGKNILGVLYQSEHGKDPRAVAEERNWKMVSDPNVLRELCRNIVLAPEHDSQLSQYKEGGKYVRKMKKFFVGKAMAQSRGTANPERLHEALYDVLEEVAPGIEEQ